MSSSAPTRAKTTELPSQLASLGLNNIADNLDDFLARATQKQLSPRQVLEQLARLEVDHKVQRSLERRFKRSKIGRFKPIADFDWNWPKKIDRGAIESALTLEFLREGRNFIVLGSNGLGKTMILKNIAYQAVLDGHSVLVRTASDMLDELDSDSPELRRQRLRKFEKVLSTKVALHRRAWLSLLRRKRRRPPLPRRQSSLRRETFHRLDYQSRLQRLEHCFS